MRDEEVGDFRLLLQLDEEVDDPRPGVRVERGDRLVADDEAWRRRERARDGDALTLPAGELARQPVECARGEAHLIEELANASASVGRGDAPPRDERFREDAPDRHRRVQ